MHESYLEALSYLTFLFARVCTFFSGRREVGLRRYLTGLNFIKTPLQNTLTMLACCGSVLCARFWMTLEEFLVQANNETEFDTLL